MIRIGHNPNTNMLPLFHFLSRNHPNFSLETAEPTGHNVMLANGEIDIAPISAFSYAEHWKDYAILPDLSVSNLGRVGSILLFSKVPLEELHDKTVALTNQSATSVNLIKVLLHHFYRVYPRYFTMVSDLEQMFSQADAALLIADASIRAAKKKPECYIYDLGEEWLRQTGLSMTYAVWAFPQKLIQEKPQDIRFVHNSLLEAKEKALSNMKDIIQDCLNLVGGDFDYWSEYFSNFKYGFNNYLELGLQKYFDLCFEEKLLPDRPLLNIWPMS